MAPEEMRGERAARSCEPTPSSVLGRSTNISPGAPFCVSTLFFVSTLFLDLDSVFMLLSIQTSLARCAHRDLVPRDDGGGDAMVDEEAVGGGRAGGRGPEEGGPGGGGPEEGVPGGGGPGGGAPGGAELGAAEGGTRDGEGSASESKVPVSEVPKAEEDGEGAIGGVPMDEEGGEAAQREGQGGGAAEEVLGGGEGGDDTDWEMGDFM